MLYPARSEGLVNMNNGCKTNPTFCKNKCIALFSTHRGRMKTFKQNKKISWNVTKGGLFFYIFPVMIHTFLPSVFQCKKKKYQRHLIIFSAHKFSANEHFSLLLERDRSTRYSSLLMHSFKRFFLFYDLVWRLLCNHHTTFSSILWNRRSFRIFFQQW